MAMCASAHTFNDVESVYIYIYISLSLYIRYVYNCIYIYIYVRTCESMTATSLYAYDCVPRMLKVYF